MYILVISTKTWVIIKQNLLVQSWYPMFGSLCQRSMSSRSKLYWFWPNLVISVQLLKRNIPQSWPNLTELLLIPWFLLFWGSKVNVPEDFLSQILLSCTNWWGSQVPNPPGFALVQIQIQTWLAVILQINYQTIMASANFINNYQNNHDFGKCYK